MVKMVVQEVVEVLLLVHQAQDQVELETLQAHLLVKEIMVVQVLLIMQLIDQVVVVEVQVQQVQIQVQQMVEMVVMEQHLQLLVLQLQEQVEEVVVVLEL
jgi:hypothetical protein